MRRFRNLINICGVGWHGIFSTNEHKKHEAGRVVELRMNLEEPARLRCVRLITG